MANSPANLSKEGTYPVADIQRIPYNIRANRVRAIWTGERRPVHKGEWFLSGAIIEAYYAPNALTSSYPIAKLYHAVQVNQWEIGDQIMTEEQTNDK